VREEQSLNASFWIVIKPVGKFSVASLSQLEKAPLPIVARFGENVTLVKDLQE
jgi:hypothetical protein